MVIVDVEIRKAIQGRNETRIEGIEYCEGWRDFAGMGISCVCTYDINTHRSRAFTVGSRASNLKDLAEYLDGKPTSGFNTKRFDLPLLEANGVKCKNPEDHYDMLEQIWLVLGLDPDHFVPKTHGGWGLDAVCQATLGIAKTGHGALAPVWWQQGHHGRVIDYCLNDVWMEGQLLIHILQGGLITNGKETVRVALPELGYDEHKAISFPLGQQAQAFAQTAQSEPQHPAAGDRAVGFVPGVGGLGIIR